jgi:hypothetical protein
LLPLISTAAVSAAVAEGASGAFFSLPSQGCDFPRFCPVPPAPEWSPMIFRSVELPPLPGVFTSFNDLLIGL